MNVAASDLEGQAQVAAFQQALQQFGWSEGRNVRIDTRWGENDVERDRRYATELLALAPDVILASGTLSVAALAERIGIVSSRSDRHACGPVQAACSLLFPSNGHWRRADLLWA
jgi:hypothetical protein